MTDFYQRLKIDRITFEEIKTDKAFNGLLDFVANTTARRKNYKEEKVEVMKNAKLLLDGQNLI